jgi:hypothetical protein
MDLGQLLISGLTATRGGLLDDRVAPFHFNSIFPRPSRPLSIPVPSFLLRHLGFLEKTFSAPS